MKKRIFAIFRFKCPHCREGDFFLEKNPFKFNNLGKVHERCASCNTKLEKEPGFYLGALYLSYGLSIGTGFFAVLIAYLLLGSPSTTILIVSAVASIVLLAPLNYLLSKIIWANLFIK